MASATARHRFLSIFLFSCLCTALPVLAQDSSGVGERALGMGGAFVGVADDTSAVYWNPAGLSKVYKFDAQIGIGSPESATAEPSPGHIVFAGASMPALGLFYYESQTGVLGAGSRQNGGSGKVQVSPIATKNLGVTVVQTVVPRLVVGSTLRLVHQTDETGFDVDAGVMATPGDLRIGLVARNVLTGADMAREARLGIAFAPRALSTGPWGPYTVDFDIDLARQGGWNDDRTASLGSEQWWAHGRVGTRAGVSWNASTTSAPAISGGVTVKLPPWGFAEGHVTKGTNAEQTGWGIGFRYAF